MSTNGVHTNGLKVFSNGSAGSNGFGPATLGLLGVVVGGSLSHGLDVRLDAEQNVEEMNVGTYVTIETGVTRTSAAQLFFGMITDIELKSTMPALLDSPPGPDDGFLQEVYRGTAAFAILKVTPMLRVADLGNAGPEPVKTVPPHFSRVRVSTQAEVERIFGAEDGEHFVIGTPLDMDVKVRLDYERFVERSNGIFGKSGTGKTFLTRLLLLNIMQKSNAQREKKKKTVHLIFDMHNEYGWKGTHEGTSEGAKGLKQLMPSSVVVLTLDEKSSQKRNVKYDAAVTIGFGDVEAEDIAILRDTLNLSENSVDACSALQHRFRKSWLQKALDLHVENDAELMTQLSIHAATLTNLQRGLNKLIRNKPFIMPEAPVNSLKFVLSCLLSGKSVVLEFGRYGSELDSYMLVASVLTRRIHDEYRDLKERELGGEGDAPPRLMITIEEAHKFLDPRVAAQTIFGEIAREMRKYNVTLLVIDQRPSMIESEVMSQIGTKITCLLDNERDIDAVLAGVSGKGGLKDVLARLESKQQALILGHAVPMPIVVRPETYEQTYERWVEDKLGKPQAKVSDLYGD